MMKKATVKIPVDIIHREVVEIEVDYDPEEDPLDKIDDEQVIRYLPFSEEEYARDNDDIEIQWDDADYEVEDDDEDAFDADELDDMLVEEDE